jgi:hypothetical protein
MPVVTTAILGAVALGVGVASGAFGGKDYLGDLIPGSTKDRMPDAPKPPDPIAQAESEGIRQGETNRLARKRTVGQLYLTRGQQRSGAEDATLGGIKQQLG